MRDGRLGNYFSMDVIVSYLSVLILGRSIDRSIRIIFLPAVDRATDPGTDPPTDQPSYRSID